MSKGMNRGMYPWKRQFVGAVMLPATWFGMAYSPWYYSLGLYAMASALFVGFPMWWWKRGRHGGKSFLNRHERKQERSDGVMSRWDHMKDHSRLAMKVRWARELQPLDDLGVGSLRALLRNPLFELRCWLQILAHSPAGYARKLGVSNHGYKFLQHNAHVLRISGPRSGKSQGLIDVALDHQGPVIMTSTRGDLIDLTQALREKIGPTFVFNAGNVGEIPNTMKWSVLAGCKNMETAKRRARDLMGPIATGTDRGTWDQRAVDVLGPLMYLAAHKGYRMNAVEKWIAVGSVEEARELFYNYIKPELLKLEDMSGYYAMGGLDLFYNLNEKTRTSATSSLGTVLSWLGSKSGQELGNSPGCELDVELGLLATNATVYVLGQGDKNGAAPLMRAFVAEIVEQARVIAETRRGRRLSPALLLALDEVPLTCPGPINEWVADMGGRGIVMDMVVQERGQLDVIWGVNGRNTIMTGCHVVMFGAGCNSADTLQDLSLLTGTRTELRNSYDANKKLTGSTEVEVPVLDPGKLGVLTTGESVYLCRGRMDVVRTPQASKRKDVRQAQRGRRREAGVPRFQREDQASMDANQEFGRRLEEGRL